MSSTGQRAEDREEAIRAALSGLVGDLDANGLAEQIGPLHRRNSTFPGEVMTHLAADALDVAGVSRENPLDYSRMPDRFLPECELRGSDHRKIHFVLHAAAMAHGGVRSDLLEELSWWWGDDYWLFATFSLVVYVRVAVERTGRTVADIAGELAGRHGVTL